MLLGLFLGSLAILSQGLLLWQWIAARRFPLHRRMPSPRFAPGVTLLKPLKGLERSTATCLRSWLEQAYAGPVQVLFGVGSLDDPVCGAVQGLLNQFPQADARLVVCQPITGANAKVAKLAHLARLARHDYLVVSDADVRAPSDLLAHLMAPLQNPGTGLVNCLYGLANPTTPALRWEAVAINADFWSQVLQSRHIRAQDFALGAVMAMPRHRIERQGGFNSLEDYLADDYHLGRRIAQDGGTIELCPLVVECWADPSSWGRVWRHQLRWARTIRNCRPLSYGLSLLNNTTWWWLLFAVATPGMTSTACALVGVGLRILAANHLQQRLMPAVFSWRYSWWIPIKDLLQVALWVLAFSGNEIRWRGGRYRVTPDGHLRQCERRPSGHGTEVNL
jgi:ceramide glucosyltransferase